MDPSLVNVEGDGEGDNDRKKNRGVCPDKDRSTGSESCEFYFYIIIHSITRVHILVTTTNAIDLRQSF